MKLPTGCNNGVMAIILALKNDAENTAEKSSIKLKPNHVLEKVSLLCSNNNNCNIIYNYNFLLT